MGGVGSPELDFACRPALPVKVSAQPVRSTHLSESGDEFGLDERKNSANLYVNWG